MGDQGWLLKEKNLHFHGDPMCGIKSAHSRGRCAITDKQIVYTTIRQKLVFSKSFRQYTSLEGSLLIGQC